MREGKKTKNKKQNLSTKFGNLLNLTKAES